MKIVITGATGMLGQALCRTLQDRHEVRALSHRDLDVRRADQVSRVLSLLCPDWVLHAAAFTAVDEAERNAGEAYLSNALGTRNIAAWAFDRGSRVLYYSTDYVFDGQAARPYSEGDLPAPINQYGHSKLAGERYLQTLCPAHLIIRTSWLYGPGGSHFIGMIQKLAQNGGPLRMVTDQRSSPTLTLDLASMTSKLLEREARGIYHVTNEGECSRYELAQEIADLQGWNLEIEPALSGEFDNTATRPRFSVLDNRVLQLDGLPLLRHWKQALHEFLDAYTCPDS